MGSGTVWIQALQNCNKTYDLKGMMNMIVDCVREMQTSQICIRDMTTLEKITNFYCDMNNNRIPLGL